MAEEPKDLNQYLEEVEKLEKARHALIEKLLADRRAIDEQLQKLGYKAVSKGRPAGSRDKQKRAAKSAGAAAR